jgi:small-conductance mechanosensitive channel
MLDANAAFLGVQVRTWILGGSIVLLVAIAHITMRWWARRRARKQWDRPFVPGESSAARYWTARALSDALPPIAFMLWLHGLCLAATTLLADYPDSTWIARVFTAVGWIRSIGTLLGLAWLFARFGRTTEALMRAHASQTKAAWDDVMLPFAGRALRIILPMIVLILGAPALKVSDNLRAMIQNAMSLLLIGAVGLILVKFVNVVSMIVLQRFRLDVCDNRRARGIYTQVTVLRKISVGVISLFAIASMLMVFPSVRQYGTAMIASAGVAGVVIGFAAQKSLGTLLAGFQIAITQPIRIDDVVIVEGEWGRIEEITLTYVVVRIWDLRRLVVPITYFIEKPFQNWTRTSAEILGTVFLQVDYGIPVDAVRSELTRILEASKLWDGKVNVLQVTDAKERTLELRVLASASDAGKAFDLRCEVREKLVAFVQKSYPSSLPRMRAVFEPLSRTETSSALS